MAKLKVYGWTGLREECPAAPNGSQQTREIVAAPSLAAAERAYGQRIRRGFVSVTANAEEVTLALSQPGIVFWRPLQGRGAWFEADSSES